MKPVVVGCGADALDQLRSDIFDLVLIDGSLTDTGGVELARRIARAPVGRGAKVVLLLSLDAVRRRPWASRNGVGACVLKPINPSRLLETIEDMLGGVVDSDEVDPAVETEAATAAHPPGEAESAGRILLAEDNEVNRLLAVRLLERRGFEVTAVPDGQAAIDALERAEGAFCAVLMDLQMPVVDGFAALQAIRQRHRAGRLPYVPVVALTAHALKEDRRRCLEAGFDDYVAKPIRAEVLYRVLDGLPTVGNSSDPPAIDAAASLARLGGDDALLRELARAALGELPAWRAELRRATRDRDIERLASLAHKLKSALAELGARRAAALARASEAAARGGEAERAWRAAADLHVELQRLRAALAALVDQPAPAGTLASALGPC